MPPLPSVNQALRSRQKFTPDVSPSTRVRTQTSENQVLSTCYQTHDSNSLHGDREAPTGESCTNNYNGASAIPMGGTGRRSSWTPSQSLHRPIKSTMGPMNPPIPLSPPPCLPPHRPVFYVILPLLFSLIYSPPARSNPYYRRWPSWLLRRLSPRKRRL